MRCNRCGYQGAAGTCPTCGWDTVLGVYPASPCALPDDVRKLLTEIAMYPHQNPTSAERRRIGTWLGIPLHMLPRAGA